MRGKKFSPSTFSLSAKEIETKKKPPQENLGNKDAFFFLKDYLDIWTATLDNLAFISFSFMI